MTAQFREIIFFKGRKQYMASEPLQYWPGFTRLKAEFIPNCTALWRGYLGTWKVMDDRLYLVHLKGEAYFTDTIKFREERLKLRKMVRQGIITPLQNEQKLKELKQSLQEIKKITIFTLFPGQKKVFADWFNGTIRIERGRLLHYVHMGYESVYEEDLFLEFRGGVLVDSRVVKNVFLPMQDIENDDL
jgi:hypothetical protein